MLQAVALIQHYNRLNGNAISPSKLKAFHAEVQRYIDSVGSGPLVPDLQGIAKRIAKALKGVPDTEPVRVQLVPIDVNSKKEGEILRVSKGYDETVETQNIASQKPANLVAEEIALTKIHTDTKRFQNRTDAFSEASADSVAKNYDPNKFDPIVTWMDPKAKKLFVLSGHSRYEGMKRRGAKAIPVRYFKGTEDEAIKFAKVEANRAANVESLVEDLAAYKLMRDGDKTRDIKAATKTELQRIFKGKVGKLEAYSHLNYNGLFIQSLSQSNTSNYPYLERNAQWVGIIRNQYPVISHTGEDNIFHFFYSDKAGRNIKLSKDDFFGMVKKKVNGLRKDESVLFPECSADGCKATVDREADPQKGEAFKRLREINEALDTIREKLTSKDATVRVTTDEEKKYLRSTADKLEEEKQRINRDLDLIDKSQASLFGYLPHGSKSKQRAKSEQKKEALRKKIKAKTGWMPGNNISIKEMKKVSGMAGFYGLECGCEEEPENGLGFTQDGQQKIYDMVTNMILEAMKKDKLFWRKGWSAKAAATGVEAHNFKTKNKYRGANFWIANFIAPSFGKTSPYFLTYKQAKELEGNVKKGAKAFPILFYNFRYAVTKPERKNISEEYYKSLTEQQKKEKGAVVIPVIMYYSVFNGDDIEGIDFPEVEVKKLSEKEKIESCEAIVEGMPQRPPIKHGGDRAFYNHSDFVQMPLIGTFEKEQEYYSVLFHELIHATGAPHRLNREKGKTHGDKQYAFEELIAELGASYLNAEAGTLYFTMNNSAAYIKGWQSRLEDAMKGDNKFFLSAAAKAQKASDFILDRVKEPAMAGPQYDAFEVEKVKPTRGPLNRLQRAALEDAIKSGRTPKVNLKAKMNAKQKPAPLFEEPTNDPKQASLFGVVKASALAGVEFFTYNLNDKYKKDLFKLNSDSVAMFFGKPGSGKTVYLLQLANYLSNDLGKETLYVSEEEFGRSTFAEKLNTFKIGNDHLSFAADLDEKIIDNFQVIFLDSVNSLQLSVQDIKALIRKHPNKTWILILQTTKEGDFRGGQDWEHLVDIAGEISNRKLILQKNRLDPDNGEKAEKLVTADLITEAKKKKQIREAVNKEVQTQAVQTQNFASPPINKAA